MSYEPSMDVNMSGDALFDNIMATSPGYQLMFSGLTNTSGEEISVVLPLATRDNYSCYPEEIGSRVEMISGKVVWETRGRIIKIHYAYDYMPPELWKKVSFFLRSSQPFVVHYFRDDDPIDMYNGYFICENLTPPKMAYMDPDRYNAYLEESGLEFVESSVMALPMWHGIDFVLRSRDAEEHDQIRRGGDTSE